MVVLCLPTTTGQIILPTNRLLVDNKMHASTAVVTLTPSVHNLIAMFREKILPFFTFYTSIRRGRREKKRNRSLLPIVRDSFRVVV